MGTVSFPLAFVAGLLSFLSPCVLPLVPAYLGYLSGAGFTGNDMGSRWGVFRHALSFVAGFTAVFVVLFGLPTSLLGNLLFNYRDLVARVGGVILILFGLHTVGLISVPMLNVTRRLGITDRVTAGHSYARSALFGVMFAAGWTPCIGPLLGAVMTMALTEPSRALALLVAYALGLALPFLLSAALLTSALAWLRRVNRYVRVIQIVSGLLIIVIGVLLVSGLFPILNGYLSQFAPEWILERT